MSWQNILIWLWVAFGVYWLASALRAKKSATHEADALRVFRLLVLALTFTLLLSNAAHTGWLGRRFMPENEPVRWAGLGVTVTGLALCIWARLHLGAYWSDKVVLKVDHRLIRTGPYARLRHPIYSGVLLAIAGTALVVGEWRCIVALVLLGVNYIVKATREERMLSSQFAEEYTSYRRQAGFLVPRF